MICDNNGNTALHIAIQVAQKNNKTTRCSEGGNDDNLTTIEKDKKEQQYLKVVKIVKLILKANSNLPLNDQEDEKMFNLNEINYQTIDDKRTDQQTNFVNKQNVFGKTALHYACFLKPDQFSIELITILLKSKANPDIPDFRNNTPLFYLLAEHQAEHQAELQQTEHQTEFQTEIRSKNNLKKCSKNCSLRSPFIDLLIDYSLDEFELDYGRICSLQQYCRKTIQKAIQRHSPKLRFHLLQNINHQLPDSLCDYLSRRTL